LTVIWLLIDRFISYLPSLTAGGALSINTATLNSSSPNPITASTAFQLYKETLAKMPLQVLKKACFLYVANFVQLRQLVDIFNMI